MTARRKYAYLDRLTPEQVRAFKRQAAEPLTKPLRADSSTVVAVGDSWFSYFPGTDIVDCLRANHHYRIINHSYAGDTIENMVYGTRFRPRRGYAPIPSRFESVLADLRRTRARILLVSGGGNDIAGNEFAQFLEHSATGLASFRRDHARHVIDVVFRKAFIELAERAAAASPGVQVFSHGYGYPIPDGRGIGIAIGLSFIGPWLRPGLAAKRIRVNPEGVAIIRELIDMFNEMLASLDVPGGNIRYVDLRTLIGGDRNAWANELHVRNSVYAAIADEFHRRMGVERAAAQSVHRRVIGRRRK